MTVSSAAVDKGYLYERVSKHIVGLLENGNLAPGDKVPSLRKLSKQLKVSISTISQAYVNLEQQGVLEVRPQSGFYVSAQLQQPQNVVRKTKSCCTPRKIKFDDIFEEIFSVANDPDIIPFGAATPAMGLMPSKGLARATSRAISANPEAAMDYCFPPGSKELRRIIAKRYMEVGLNISADEVIITSGATEALAMSLKAVAQRGDIIAVESPTYFSVLRLIECAGMLAVEIDSDPETGLCLDALESALDTMKIKAVLTVANFSNPMGSLMPDENKKRLVSMLEQRDVPLIEDDIYGDLYFDDKRPSIGKCYETKGKVLTCSSFSKSLAPGYRIGWVINQHYYDQMLEWKQATTSAVSSLSQIAVKEFLISGEYERHLVRLRKDYRQQVEKMRFLIAQFFPENTRVSNPRGGFILWVELPRGTDCLEVFNRAISKGISITPGILFSATRRYRNFIRMNCGHPWTPELEAAVETLGNIIADMQIKLN